MQRVDDVTAHTVAADRDKNVTKPSEKNGLSSQIFVPKPKVTLDLDAFIDAEFIPRATPQFIFEVMWGQRVTNKEKEIPFIQRPYWQRSKVRTLLASADENDSNLYP